MVIQSICPSDALRRYTSQVIALEPAADLTKADLRFLRILSLLRLLGQKTFSVWSVRNHLNNDRRKDIAYKNVHVKMKKLRELKLIEKVEGKFLHGAIHYRLSQMGWIFLFPEQMGSGEYRGHIMENYDFALYQLIFDPFFEKKTLEYLDQNIYDSLFFYARDCCKNTIEAVNFVKLGPRKQQLSITDLEKELSKILEISFRSSLVTLIRELLAEQAEIHNQLRSVLAEDTKFIATLIGIRNEFDSYYDDMTKRQ
jgi:hypothetical protein